MSEGEIKDLKKLPSKTNYYDKFESSGYICSSSGTEPPEQEKQLRQKLKEEYKEVYILTSLITKAYCVACKMKEGAPQDNTPCRFLYYWLGNEIRSYIGQHKLSDVLQAIYRELSDVGGGHKCEITYKDVENDEELFKYRKKVFEHDHDYDTVQSYLRQGNTDCLDNWTWYEVDILPACNAVSAYCSKPQNMRIDYCTEFEGKYKKHCYQKLDDSNCKLVLVSESQTHVTRPDSRDGPTAESAATCTGNQNTGSPKPGSTGTCNPGSSGSDGGGSHSKGGEEASSSSDGGNIVGSVSGGLATVGLPAIGFLLYKYTDVFDGIKKSLFGGSNRNRRLGRSTVRRQHFEDTFTGNDSSTLGGDGSTTLGGGGGESSTLDGSSTDVSTIYDDEGRGRPIGRARTGTNNRRPGNIRYYAT
ncbi:KIR protein [Plasmodium knowlesi strain H]|uniref:KIR protein n=2 Tax=Plasmodium knowlesi TaxID=5850 RepID=B3LBZ9_PLAKH|nr:KIR protein [Plasmodium knowlesi strain H]OTN64117.1 KIR protein [Plasmodium knowlesi]CAA9990791.1 KIR protein [Plasmodium knowlesi strain H]VVS80265.1 KIR protein [Plasmodium knowlesi strain H]|eukprot:XP_002262080.1 KIR protein [Plasmodium knowlesi strain H]